MRIIMQFSARYDDIIWHFLSWMLFHHNHSVIIDVIAIISRAVDDSLPLYHAAAIVYFYFYEAFHSNTQAIFFFLLQPLFIVTRAIYSYLCQAIVLLCNTSKSIWNEIFVWIDLAAYNMQFSTSLNRTRTHIPTRWIAFCDVGMLERCEYVRANEGSIFPSIANLIYEMSDKFDDVTIKKSHITQ